jgi:hypothetical protein
MQRAAKRRWAQSFQAGRERPHQGHLSRQRSRDLRLIRVRRKRIMELGRIFDNASYSTDQRLGALEELARMSGSGRDADVIAFVEAARRNMRRADEILKRFRIERSRMN